MTSARTRDTRRRARTSAHRDGPRCSRADVSCRHARRMPRRGELRRVRSRQQRRCEHAQDSRGGAHGAARTRACSGREAQGLAAPRSRQGERPADGCKARRSQWSSTWAAAAVGMGRARRGGGEGRPRPRVIVRGMRWPQSRSPLSTSPSRRHRPQSHPSVAGCPPTLSPCHLRVWRVAGQQQQQLRRESD